jgi:hypothetical protein
MPAVSRQVDPVIAVVHGEGRRARRRGDADLYLCSVEKISNRRAAYPSPPTMLQKTHLFPQILRAQKRVTTSNAPQQHSIIYPRFREESLCRRFDGVEPC